jgi:hypothetical protein
MESLRWIRRSNAAKFGNDRAGTAAAICYVLGAVIVLDFGINVLMTAGSPWLLVGLVALLAGVEVTARALLQR